MKRLRTVPYYNKKRVSPLQLRFGSTFTSDPSPDIIHHHRPKGKYPYDKSMSSSTHKSRRVIILWSFSSLRPSFASREADHQNGSPIHMSSATCKLLEVDTHSKVRRKSGSFRHDGQKVPSWDIQQRQSRGPKTPTVILKLRPLRIQPSNYMLVGQIQRWYLIQPKNMC